MDQNQKTKLEQYSQSMHKSAIERDTKAMTTEMTKLINDDYRTKMPEDVFKNYFADYFKNFSKTDGDEAKLLEWISIAGGNFRAVDLVNTKGEVVDTVPSVLYQPDVLDSFKNVDFNKIAQTYINKSNHYKAKGEQYLAEELNKISPIIIDHKGKEAHAREWDRVIDKYTTPEKKIVNVKNENISDKVKEQLGLDVIYDD